MGTVFQKYSKSLVKQPFHHNLKNSMLPIIILSLISTRINGHSWVRCTDYSAEITGRDYDEDQCNGWIRDWQFSGITFAQDRGINYQVSIGSGGSICGGNSMDGNPDSDYSSDYANSDKITRYTVGSTVRVVWPAKNHANYECYGNIPVKMIICFSSHK